MLFREQSPVTTGSSLDAKTRSDSPRVRAAAPFRTTRVSKGAEVVARLTAHRPDYDGPPAPPSLPRAFPPA